jgi:putative cardiolipin synthase
VQRKRAQLSKQLEEHRKQNPAYFDRAEQLSDRMSKLQPELPWVWATGHAVYDTPEKMGDRGALETVTHIGPRLLQQLDPIQSELVMIAAYFIPGNGGAEKLGALARRGVSVSVITNGLASTDVTAVFAAYAVYRERLVRDGVQLYEIRTDPGVKAKARELGLAFGASAVSLHTKAIVFDGSKAFIGSMNLDPRSQRWNTEVGVLVDSREVAQQVLALARIAMRPENSYRVVLEAQDHGTARLTWIASENGREARHMSEPAGSWRRFKATITDPLLPQELL